MIEKGVTVSIGSLHSEEGKGINFGEDVDKDVTIENLEIDAQDIGIYFANRILDGGNFSDLKIKSDDKQGIKFNKEVEGSALTIEGVKIEASQDGIRFKEIVSAPLTVRQSQLYSDEESGIVFEKDINADVSFSDLLIETERYGIDFNIIGENIDFTLSNIKIHANENDGIMFVESVASDINATQLDIDAGNTALHFYKQIAGLHVDGSRLTGNNRRGIRFEDEATGEIELEHLDVSGYTEGIYTVKAEVTLKNSQVKSQTEKAIYLKSDDDTTRIYMRDTCVKTESSDDYGLYLYTGNTDSDVEDSCFYAEGGDTKLAKAKVEGNHFAQNYWDGHDGDYTMNYISDTDTRSKCHLLCWVNFTLRAEWRMDECEWNGTDGEVTDSTGYGYDGTAHGANTVTDGLCKVGDLSDDGADDYLLLDHEALDGLDAFSVAVWFKTAQNRSQQDILQALGNDDDDDELEIYLYENDKVKVKIKDTSQSFSLDTQTDDNTWHQLVLTREDDTACLYFDGSKVSCQDDYPTGALSVQAGSLIIGQEQDSVGGDFDAAQSFVGYLDELKIFEGVLDESDVQSIYNNEKDGKNWDGSARSCQECGNPNENQVFDVWDDFRSISDRNISTKRIGENFTLTLASLDGSDYANFNGTVCSRVVYTDDITHAMTDWQKSLFSEDNVTQVSFTVSKAAGDLSVDIHWKYDVDESCPLDDEDNRTLSSDNFAVRPDRFTVNASGSNKAGESLTLDFGALDGSGAAALDYNETEGGSFEVRYRETDADCITGVFDPPIDDGWQFADGNRSIDTRYSEVGSVELNVSEAVTCEDRFAAVDCDDGDVDGTWSKEENLSITPAGLTLRFYPHHFDLNATLYSFDNGPFTYLSKDLNMSAYVVFDIVAKNGQNERTANYIDVCYAKDINLSLTHADVDADALGKLGYMISDADEVNGSVNWDYGKNETVKWQMPASSFSTANSRVDTNGTTAFVFYFNFDRNASLPVSPFDLNLTDAGVDDGDAQSDGYETLEGNTTFYYGRLRADDLTTTLDDAPHRYRIEIYSKTALNLRRMSLYWYLNAAHDSGSQGHVSATRVTDGVRLTDTEDGDVTLDGILDDPTDGVNDFVISDSTPKRRVVHMAVPSWLWFVPDGFGGSYLYDTGDSNSDCTRHPCFIYTRLRGAGSRRGVLSGGYEGSDFNVTESPKTRSGVKLFR
ncbi:MAG: hypothetical protein GXO33_04350 [Epsilonproteobacteria bacterium]|nr:hypothetical protein [Campylobacterota bacterium]